MKRSIANAGTSARPSNHQQGARFVPTHDELFQLARYWAKEAISDEYFIFWGQCFGHHDLRRIDDSWARVSEIKATLGSARTKIAVQQAYQEAATEFEDRSAWIVFRYGTGGEREVYQERGGQGFREFEKGESEDLASMVMRRVFREGTQEEQERLRKDIPAVRARGKAKQKASRWPNVIQDRQSS